MAAVHGVEIEDGSQPARHELRSLYDSVGWTAYTNDIDSLVRAVDNSTFVVTARADERLVGLARAISDDESIVYVQDVLVDPAWQRRGVGRALLERCLGRFSHVRQRVLLTDDEPHQHRLYRAVGFRDVRDTQLHAFVEIDGVEPG